MSLFPRLLAPMSVAVALAAAAPAAQAASSVAFPPLPDAPVTTVEITDLGPDSDTVQLTVTAAVPADLANTKVFLGMDSFAPYIAIGVDGVRDARYAGPDDFVDGELSTDTCAVYDSSLQYDAPVVVAGDGASFSADLPKGEVIAFEETRVAVGIVGDDVGCDSFGFHGLEIDYVNSHQTIDGFSWTDPAAPVVTHVAGGRRQVALSFDQAPGTQYDIYRVGAAVPFAANIRGDGDAVQVVLTEDAAGERLTPATEYAFQVRATRLFNIWQGEEMIQPTSPLSAVGGATTAAVQTLQFTATPAASTTEQTARFSWSINANDAGEVPWCGLDLTDTSGTELPCTATGASIDGLAGGAHTRSVYPPHGEGVYTYSWTVTAVPVPAAPVPAPNVPVVAAPVVVTDPDGDGIKNTWLVGGKPAAAPGVPKARALGGDVKLKLGTAPRGAKKIRVFRAVGRGSYKLVKTLAPKTGAFTDKNVKAGRTYSYKTVGVNATGQQGKASKKATVQVPKPR
jgi:hypothetical protein